MIRLKNEEKTEVEEQCQKLMKEAGITTNGHLSAKMAAASWRYMIHNLPSLLSDFTFFNKNISQWQNKSTPSESEWTKQLLSSLDDSTSPYSRLPSHIKSIYIQLLIDLVCYLLYNCILVFKVFRNLRFINEAY